MSISYICILVLCCHAVVADTADPVDQSKLNIQCRDWDLVAVRCAKVSPNMTLHQPDVEFLTLRETCCVIQHEAQHVRKNATLYAQYVPDFCHNIKSLNETEEDKIKEYVWRLSHATELHGGTVSWQLTWREVRNLLQQACNPMALIQIIGGVSASIKKFESRADSFDVLFGVFTAPFEKTAEWSKPVDQRNVIKAINELVLDIPAIKSILHGWRTLSTIVLCVLALYAACFAFDVVRGRPVLSAMASLALVLLLWRSATERVDYLMFACAVITSFAFCGFVWLARNKRKRLHTDVSMNDGNVIATVVGWMSHPSTVAQLIADATFVIPALADVMEDWLEFLLGRMAKRRGTLPHFVLQGANAAIGGNVQAPNNSETIRVRYATRAAARMQEVERRAVNQ
jgi:hypothetical protein